MIAEDWTRYILFPRKYFNDGTVRSAAQVDYAQKFQQLLNCDWPLVIGPPFDVSKQCVNTFD